MNLCVLRNVKLFVFEKTCWDIPGCLITITKSVFCGYDHRRGACLDAGTVLIYLIVGIVIGPEELRMLRVSYRQHCVCTCASVFEM